MKLSVSNLSWPQNKNEWCLKKLKELEFDGIEIAPLKTFKRWEEMNATTCSNVKNFINEFYQFSKKNKNFAIMLPNHGNISSKKDLVEGYEQEGSVFLFNKKILKKIGFYDERFFLYFEEIDLFLRCKKNNLKVFFASNFKIKHNRASSISINKEKIKNLRPVPISNFKNKMIKEFYKDSKKVSNKKMKNKLLIKLKYPTYKEGLRNIFNNPR